MPITLEEFEKLEKERKVRGKVNWTEVLETMRASKQAYTTKDIMNLIGGAVNSARVNGWLRKKTQEGILVRRWDGQKYYYIHVDVLATKASAPSSETGEE